MEYDCLILGAGLSGLYTALQLQQRGLRCIVLEARERPGGRILGVAAAGSDTRLDLGPAWIWPEFQPLVSRLTQALGIEVFAQQTEGSALYEGLNQPEPLRIDGESPNAHSFRISGSTFRLIEALAARLTPETLCTGRRVGALQQLPDAVGVRTINVDGSEERRTAPRVVSTIPPRLLAGSVRFEPALPTEHAASFASMPTWMAAHAKFIACYPQPFWRDAGLSGEVFSRRGPLTEIYDASPVRGGPYALFGFFGLPAHARHTLGRAELAERSIAQLERLFGTAASIPIEWHIKDWSKARFTATATDAVPPAGHPAYGLPVAQRTLWDGRLVFAGSETSTGQGGYLEGALESAALACEHIARSVDA